MWIVRLLHPAALRRGRLRNPTSAGGTQWSVFLADIPYKALASCHQRASLVIRFRCRSTDAVAVLDGTFNIPLIGQTSYYNLTQTLDNHPILGIADIFTLRSEYEIDPVAIEFRYLAADHL